MTVTFTLVSSLRCGLVGFRISQQLDIILRTHLCMRTQFYVTLLISEELCTVVADSEESTIADNYFQFFYCGSLHRNTNYRAYTFV